MPRHGEQARHRIAHWHHHNVSERSIPSRMLDADVEVHCSSGTHSLSFKTTFYEDYTTAKPGMSSEGRGRRQQPSMAYLVPFMCLFRSATSTVSSFRYQHISSR